MKLRTKVDVTYNAPGKVTGQESGIVEGILINTAWIEDFNTIGANYVYLKPDETVITKNGFTVSGDDIEALYAAISPNIPTGENHKDTERTKYYLAFIVEMANTFSIQPSDIEIITE